MNPELKQLTDELNALKEKVALLENSASIPYPVEEAFKERLNLRILDTLPTGLEDAPLSSVTDPTGGATIDSQARTAIITVINRLESLGLVDAN